jgi:hypothetical protein
MVETVGEISRSSGNPAPSVQLIERAMSKLQ